MSVKWAETNAGCNKYLEFRLTDISGRSPESEKYQSNGRKRMQVVTNIWNLADRYVRLNPGN